MTQLLLGYYSDLLQRTTLPILFFVLITLIFVLQKKDVTLRMVGYLIM